MTALDIEILSSLAALLLSSSSEETHPERSISLSANSHTVLLVAIGSPEAGEWTACLSCLLVLDVTCVVTSLTGYFHARILNSNEGKYDRLFMETAGDATAKIVDHVVLHSDFSGL